MIIIAVLIIAGMFFDSVVFKVLGFGFLFIINFPLITPGIDYKDGELAVTLNSSHTDTQNQYANFQAFHIFSFLALIGVYGTAFFSWYEYDLNQKKRERE